jgi:hypothetical protein
VKQGESGDAMGFDKLDVGEESGGSTVDHARGLGAAVSTSQDDGDSEMIGIGINFTGRANGT